MAREIDANTIEDPMAKDYAGLNDKIRRNINIVHLLMYSSMCEEYPTGQAFYEFLHEATELIETIKEI